MGHLLGQPNDLLQYLCTYLDTHTNLEVWQTNRRLNKIVSECVPLRFSITSNYKWLWLKSLFNRFILTVPVWSTIDTMGCKVFGQYITELDLQDNGIGPVSTIRSKDLQYMPNITELNIRGNNIIDNRELNYLPNLRVLRMGGNTSITDEGLKGLTHLTNLDIFLDCNITDIGIMSLTKLTKLVLWCYNPSYPWSYTDIKITNKCVHKIKDMGVEVIFKKY